MECYYYYGPPVRHERREIHLTLRDKVDLNLRLALGCGIYFSADSRPSRSSASRRGSKFGDNFKEETDYPETPTLKTPTRQIRTFAHILERHGIASHKIRRSDRVRGTSRRQLGQLGLSAPHRRKLGRLDSVPPASSSSGENGLISFTTGSRGLLNKNTLRSLTRATHERLGLSYSAMHSLISSSQATCFVDHFQRLEEGRA